MRTSFGVWKRACYGGGMVLLGACVSVWAEAAVEDLQVQKVFLEASNLQQMEMKTNLEALQSPVKARARDALDYFKKHRFTDILVLVAEQHPIDELRALAAEDLADLKAYRTISALNRILTQREEIEKGWERKGPTPEFWAFQARTGRIVDAFVRLQKNLSEEEIIPKTNPLPDAEIARIKEDKRSMQEILARINELREKQMKSMTEDEVARQERKEKEAFERRRELTGSN